MGLFDTIDRLNAAEQPESYLQPAEQPPATSTTDQRQNAIAEDSGPDTWIRSAAEIEERRRILRRKPERLSFLAPCPLCHGRAFLHIEGGGFAMEIELEDTDFSQAQSGEMVQFDRVVNTDRIKLTVTSVYVGEEPGSSVCISELAFY